MGTLSAVEDHEDMFKEKKIKAVAFLCCPVLCCYEVFHRFGVSDNERGSIRAE